MKKIIFYKTDAGKSPIEDFLDSLPDKTVEKITFVLRIVRDIQPTPTRYLKKLVGHDNLWEIRVDFGSNTFRLLCFLQKNNLIVVTNAFTKKTNKIPRKEIWVAQSRKIEYLRRNYE